MGASPSWHHTCLPCGRSRAKAEQSYGFVAASWSIFGSVRPTSSSTPDVRCHSTGSFAHGLQEPFGRFCLLDGEVKRTASSPGLLALDHARLDRFLQLLLHLAHGLPRQFGQAPV